MKLIAEGNAPKITQPAEGATYECIQKKDNAKVIQTAIPKPNSCSSKCFALSLFGINLK